MMRKLGLSLLLCLLILPFLGRGQAFSDSERLQGYLHRNDTSYFLFDAKLYGLTEVRRAVLTGSFREWSQDMDDPSWQIKDGVLALPNPNFTNIPPRSEFKFRINDGKWLEPPTAAPNKKGGNLLFMHDMIVPSLKAEILSSGNIWLKVEGLPRPLASHSFRLTDASNQEVPISEVLPNTETESLLIPAKPIDIKRVYFVEIPAYGLKSWCSYDGWFRHLYSSKELGANVNEKGTQTVFRIFAPRAVRVMLHLYDQKRGGTPSGSIEMFQDDDGVWEIMVDKDLKGTWYDFTVHGAGDPGNHFYEQNPVHISDPYARVNDDAWGRSMVWERTQPASPLKNGIPPLQDVIAYEVHVQDFTDRLPVAKALKGSFPAFIKPGLKNKQGEPIGFDHLLKLGINVVHLMPVQEYMHYPDEVWRKSFEKDPFMIKHGINKENYQWGYRTSHAFAVENRYRSKDAEPGEERNQFRDLVQAFHDHDIAVIIDIVPNHSAENMDSEPHFFHWNVLDKIYHYRTRHLDHIGEYGNEIKTENRPMNQRWLIDQCKHFIEEFGVDGFRVDLAGQIDRQTLSKLRQAVGDDIIIYGEPWIPSEDPDYESNPSWDWYKHNSPICFFQDDARNAIKGPVSNPVEKERDRGYAGANFREFEKVKLAISSRFPDDHTPLSGINYLDIHDNWALADQFGTHNWDGRFGVDEERVKLAALLLYTSLGPIVLNGGTEILRSKGHAELKETIKEMTDGTKVYFHGKRDTYNMRVPNQFVWENVGKTLESEDSYCDYANMLAYWQWPQPLSHERIWRGFPASRTPAGRLLPVDRHPQSLPTGVPGGQHRAGADQYRLQHPRLQRRLLSPRDLALDRRHRGV
jgi:pullulanase